MCRAETTAHIRKLPGTLGVLQMAALDSSHVHVHGHKLRGTLGALHVAALDTLHVHVHVVMDAINAC